MTCNHENPELCERLGKHITGKLWLIWTGTSNLSAGKEDAYRRNWIERAGLTVGDVQQFLPNGPRVTALAKNFAKAVAKDAKNKRRRVTDKTKARRLRQCESCSLLDANRMKCRHPDCGCNLKVKAGWASESCPLGKWDFKNMDDDKPVPDHPIEPHVTRFAVGVTTAPRKQWTLGQSLKSLMDSGFDEVTLFAEPHAAVRDCRQWSGVSLVRRPETIAPLNPGLVPAGEGQKEQGRFGCWQNYVQSMADLLAMHPDAQAIALIQDDAVFAKGIREFLEHDLWPSPSTGCVSVYTSRVHENEATGCRSRRDFGKMGAVANFIPRHVAEAIVRSPRARSWRGNQSDYPPEDVNWLKKAADTWLGRCIAGMKLKSYSYTPSLAQHISRYSAVGHGDNSGKRSSRSFVGEHVDVRNLFEERNAWPRVRFSLPGKERRYKPCRNRSTVRVAIPAVNSPDLTTLCLEHLARSTWTNLIVDYIDNGSDAGVLDEVVSRAKALDLKINPIRFERNEGFTPAVNASLRLAHDKSQFLLILNNDCFVAPDTIEKLFRALYLEDSIACTGPFSCDRGHQSLRKEKRLAQSGLAELPSDPGNVVRISRSLTRTTVSSETMLAFFCTLISPYALKRVGPLPDEYPDGLGADDVWCRAARRRKLRCELVHDAYAHHAHSETFRRLGLDRKAMQQVAIAKLKGRSPREVRS